MAVPASTLTNTVNYGTSSLTTMWIGVDNLGTARSEKSTLDALRTAIIAGINGTTNLSATASPTNMVVTSSTGTSATLGLANGTVAGLLAPADFSKLAFITVSSAVNLGTLNANSHAAATAGNTSINVSSQAISVRLSATPGNQIALNGDGLYVAPAPASSADRLLGAHDMGTVSGNVTIDLNAGASRNKRMSLSGNVTFTIATGAVMGDFTLLINPNNYSITWPINVVFEGSVPSLTGTTERGVKMFYSGT